MEFNATFIVSAISFIAFTLIMNAIFYKPLDKVVRERQKFIDENYNEAKIVKEQSETILQQKEDTIEKTKSDAKKIISTKIDEVKNQRTDMTAQARQKASQAVDEAKSEIQKSKEEAQNVLTDNVVDIAKDISAKILGENIEMDSINKEDIEKLIKES